MSPHTHPGGGQPRSLKQSEARERAALIDVTAYDVTLDLDQGAESFGSLAVIDLVSEGGPTFLDLQPVNVNAVTVNRQPLDIGPLDHGRLPIRTEPGDNHALLATDRQDLRPRAPVGRADGLRPAVTSW